MRYSGVTTKLGSNSKNALVSTFLVANAFVWYLCTFKFLQDAAGSAGFVGNSLILIITINFLSLVSALFIASSLTEKIKQRIIFLKYWILAGVLLSGLFAIVNLANFASILIVSGVLGAYFGVGMPICMGYYSATTEPQNRAKLGGIVILLIGLGFPILSSVGTTDTFLTSSVLALWRVLGFIFLVSLKPIEKNAELKDKISFRTVVSNKGFVLFLVPWLMFSLINQLTMQINTNYFGSSIFPSYFGGSYSFIENIIAGASAIVCGFLADKKGRKRLALIGFALLGIGYASLGLFKGNLFTAWFYVCVDGVAWGAFSMLFLVTLWGDIAQERNSERYYVLGVIPYLFSNLIGFSFGTYIANNMTESTVFSFASFFLFIATLPLVYAPETLPDKIIRNMDLNNYVHKALEKVQKHTDKNLKKQSTENIDEKEIIEEPESLSLEDVEARKLAEKYY